MQKQKNIALCIILSILTCGIYGLYWVVCLQDDMNELTNEYSKSGVTVLLLSIVTCGIYSLFWAYQIGERIDDLKEKRGMRSGNNTGLLLLLCALFTGFIHIPIIQSNINKFYEN